MALNIELLRQSFDLFVEREPDLMRHFYDVLFVRYPQAEPLFGRTSRDNQAKMLTEALIAVLDHLDDAPWLEHRLGGLGAKHVEYGVTPEMYGWVGESLLVALADIAGPEWNTELAAAWADAYGAIASLMLKGAATDARPETASGPPRSLRSVRPPVIRGG